MSSKRQAIATKIATMRKQKMSDDKIFTTLLSSGDVIGKSLRAATNEALQTKGTVQDVAKYIGLNISAPSFGDKVKAGFSSVGMGAIESFGGINQLIAMGTDKLGLTPHGMTESVNNTLQDYRNGYEADRLMAGKKSTDSDLIKAGTEVGALLVGGSAGKGASLTGRALTQGAVGVAQGAAHTAKDNKERGKNMAWGAVGGGSGEVISAKVVAPLAGKVATKVERRAANKAGATSREAQKLVDDAITSTKIAVTPAERTAMVKTAEKALTKGKVKDAPALVRKTLLDRHGIKGTQAQITRDPATWGAEREMAKHSPELNQVHIDNHQQIQDILKTEANATGANAVDTETKMANTIAVLKQVDADARAKSASLYESARNMPESVNAHLDHNKLADDILTHLKANGESDKFDGIKSIIEGKLNPSGKLTLQDAEAAKQVLNRQIASTSDGNKRWALGQAKDFIDKHIDDAVATDPNLAPVQQAWSDAKNAYKDHAQAVENTPALKGAIDDVAPDQAFNKFVINGKTRDLGALVQTLKSANDGGQSLKDLQGATIEHFLNKATTANNGAFSPAQLARAIDSFGEHKLKVLFSPEQIARLNDIRQVSDILMQQPLGAHVNHSNTANVVIKQLLGLTGMAARVPMLGTVGNIVLGGTKAAADLSKGGQAVRMINGVVPTVEKNSLLGLTRAQRERIGITEEMMRKLTTATAKEAGIGD